MEVLLKVPEDLSWNLLMDCIFGKRRLGQRCIYSKAHRFETPRLQPFVQALIFFVYRFEDFVATAYGWLGKLFTLSKFLHLANVPNFAFVAL